MPNKMSEGREGIEELSITEYRALILKEMKEALQNNLPFAVNTEFPAFMSAFEKMIDGYADKIQQTHHQELQKAQIEALWEAVDLADKIESREPDGGTKQWMAFKAFRNTLRDRIKDQSELDQPNN